MARSKVVDFDYYQFLNLLQRATNAGARIERSDSRWEDYVKQHAINEVAALAIARQKFEGAIAVIIGPALFTFTFAYFIDAKHGWNIPGAPWYLAALLLFFAMIMSTRIPRVSAENESAPPVPAVSGNAIPLSGIAPDVVPIVEPEENV